MVGIIAIRSQANFIDQVMGVAHLRAGNRPQCGGPGDKGCAIIRRLVALGGFGGHSPVDSVGVSIGKLICPRKFSHRAHGAVERNILHSCRLCQGEDTAGR